MPGIVRRGLVAVRSVLRRVLNQFLDLLDRLTGRHNPMVPPRNKVFIGDGNFLEVGELFLGHFRRIADLQPNERVLELGCGLGRMAIPLTGYLSSGEYDGMDVVKDGIDWCQSRIATRYPNFRFQRADIYNKLYNPDGAWRASEYRFPFPDDHFDFVFLTSVFTHMLPSDVAHYLDEIGRVTRPGGRCLATFFLMTPEARELIASGASVVRLSSDADGYTTDNPDTPETAVGYTVEDLRAMVDAAGLVVDEPIRYGSWCGRAEYTDFQDIVLLRRPDKTRS